MTMRWTLTEYYTYILLDVAILACNSILSLSHLKIFKKKCCHGFSADGMDLWASGLMFWG